MKEVGRENEQSISSFKAGLGCYPPVIASHLVPEWLAFLQTSLISELCAVPCPWTGPRSNCNFLFSDWEGQWKSQHAPSPDKAPGFQLRNPVLVRQAVTASQCFSLDSTVHSPALQSQRAQMTVLKGTVKPLEKGNNLTWNPARAMQREACLVSIQNMRL